MGKIGIKIVHLDKLYYVIVKLDPAVFVSSKSTVLITLTVIPSTNSYQHFDTRILIFGDFLIEF